MLEESLDETLEAARICVFYEKTNSKWGRFNNGGCLGFPAGILLFSIIDAIGSYFWGDKTFNVNLDGKQVTIGGDGWEHFKILNSKYFNKTLSSSFLKVLYKNFRCSLVHNATLRKAAFMHPDNSDFPNLAGSNEAFAMSKDQDGNEICSIFMKELFFLCENAVKEFKKDIDAVVPISKQGKFH